MSLKLNISVLEGMETSLRDSCSSADNLSYVVKMSEASLYGCFAHRFITLVI